MADIQPNVVVSMLSQQFTMPNKFASVFNGKIYIGKIDTDPRITANQIQVYIESEGGSHVPVPQPIRTNAAGFPVYNGHISKFVTVEGQSMLVTDANDVQLFYFPNVLKYDPDQFKLLLAGPDGVKYVGNAVDKRVLVTAAGADMVGFQGYVGGLFTLDDYFKEGYILVSSRDELIAAQNVIKTVMLKRTEIRLSRNFAPWTAAQTDIDLAWVTITGHADGTYIDATGIPNVEGNYFIRFYNSGGLDINRLPSLEGLRFSGVSVKGPSRSSLVDGMLFHSPDHQMGNLTIGYFNIQEFRRGISFQTNAYIIKVMNSVIARCNMAGVDQPTGFSNYGENISLFGCTIGVSSGPAVHIQNGDGGFHLYGCSLDYTGQVIVSEGGYVECHGGHHEFGNSSNPLTGTPYIATNAQTARITLRGTKVVNIRSAGMTEQYLVRSDTAADGVYFLGALLQNTVTASGTLKYGDGRFVINDSQVQNGAGNHRLTVFQSEYENLMVDGSNDATIPLDWYVRRVNNAVTSRTSGDNITLSNSTEMPRNGAKSLKVAKSTAGTNHGIGLIAPVAVAQQPSFRFYVYPISGTTGSIFTESYFVAVQGFDQYGRPNIIKLSASMGIRTTLLTGSSSWQSVVSYPSKTPVPSWATHIFTEVNSSGLSIGGYYIADAGIWQI